MLVCLKIFYLFDVLNTSECFWYLLMEPFHSESLVPFYGQMMFHCMDLPYFVYPFTCQTLWLLPPWGCLWRVMLLWTLPFKGLFKSFFSSFGFIPMGRIAESFGNFIFRILCFEKPPICLEAFLTRVAFVAFSEQC